MVNWSRYLESLCNAYAQWWQVYTITDVVGQKGVESEPSLLLFDFGLMVQTVERDREERRKGEEKVERLTVLEGLRKYASEHVLLVGRPGSGKSTALVRLVLEEAQKNLTPQPPSLRGKEEQESSPILGKERGEHFSPLLAGEGQGERSTKVQGNQPTIPVLVELRYYRTSILDLIQDFLQRHEPNLTVDAETLKSWLRQSQLLLLVDGLNELPSEEARRDLQKFRQDYQKTTPMMFTTRDLGVGGDLDIAKKLEMQPLSEGQMQQFVRAYLSEQGEQMLRQLGSRLREFGQTPLLLWMLCSLFRAMGKVPPNLGLVFRQFALSYDRKLKQDIPISKESRRWWHRLLEQLAWVMTSGVEKTQLQVAIPRQKAQAVLTEFLAGKVAHPEDCALGWLEDLLNYHLIQLGAGDQIEFRHQLIQEYYTAESLLKLLPSLSDDELKREYLNYLKWTEPLALMLELVEDEPQAVRVVKLALEVDLRLGARLAGEAKPDFQQKTVSMIAEQEIPEWFRLFLLGETKSPKAADELMKTIKHPDSSIRSKSVWASRQLGCEAAMPVIFRAIEDSNPNVRETAIRVIGELGSEQAIPLLTQILTKEPIASVREAAASGLQKLDSEAAILALLRATQDTDHNVSVMAIYYLEEMSREIGIPVLTKALKKNIDASLRKGAAKLLGKLGDERIISNLFEAQLDLNTDVHHKAYYALDTVRKRATVKESDVKKHQEVQRKQQIKMSLGYLNSKEPVEKGNAILDLASLLDKEVAVPLVTQVLDDPHHYVRGHAITSLVRLIGKEAVPLAVRALNDPHYDVRNQAAQALTGLGENLPDNLEIPDETVSKLIQILNEEQNTYVRRITVTTLTNLCSIQPSLLLREELESAFLNASDASDNFLRSSAATGLGKFSSERVSGRLLQMVGDSDFSVALSATEALKNMPFIITAKHLPALIELNLTSTESWALDVIFKIQERCKLYNYTLTQPVITTPPRLMYILHLSDLHFGTPDQANLWSNQLAADLYNDRNIPHLDALILSGDIANYSTEEEYQAAEQFLHNLRQDFPLNPEQIILVPGNHDLNWKLAKKAYKLIDRDEYDGELKDGHYIEESAI